MMQTKPMIGRVRATIDLISDVSNDLKIPLPSRLIVHDPSFVHGGAYVTCDLVISSAGPGYLIVVYSWFDEATRTDRKNWKRIDFPSQELFLDYLAGLKAEIKAAVLEVQQPDYVNIYWPENTRGIKCIGGDGAKKKLPAVRLVMLCANGALCVFDGAGNQIPEYQSLAGHATKRNIQRILRASDDNIKFEVQYTRGGPMWTCSKGTLPKELYD